MRMSLFKLTFGVFAASVFCVGCPLLTDQLQAAKSMPDVGVPPDPCGDPSVQDLTAGQHIDVGSITIANDEDNLYVTYATTGGWLLNTMHVHIGTSTIDVPMANGSPIPGQFAYKAENVGPVVEYTIAIPFADLGLASGDCGMTRYVFAHAEVYLKEGDEVVIGGETAWGGDTPGATGGKWYFLAEYQVQCCGGGGGGGGGEFRTQTQGGWGTLCHGENPGCYRDEWFATAFPNGVTIGCDDGFVLTCETSADVYNFLPTGGKPAPLTQDVLNPVGKTSAGVFAGQLLALALTLGFDGVDPDFGAGLGTLALQEVCDTGLTVGAIFDEANLVIGGCEGTLGLNAGELSTLLTTINENYVDGEADLGDLCSP